MSKSCPSTVTTKSVTPSRMKTPSPPFSVESELSRPSRLTKSPSRRSSFTVPSMPRSEAVVLPTPFETTRFPSPPERSLIASESPLIEASTRMPDVALIRETTSLTVVAWLRSTSALPPERSVMVMIPRCTPSPPLRSERGTS